MTLTRTAPAARGSLLRVYPVLRDLVVALVVWQLWQVPVSLFLNLPPRLAVLWLTSLSAFFLWCHALPGGVSSARGRATARVRALRKQSLPWLALLSPLMCVGALAMWMLLTSLRWVRDRPLPPRLEDYGNRPGGGVVLVLMIVLVAPLVEEFVFRGWVQRPLERRLGAHVAIPLTALLFALAHLEPGGIPIRMLGGLGLGYAVWATGSIWAGVVLHLAWNAGVLFFGAAYPELDPARFGARMALPAALALLAAVAGFAVIAPRLRRHSAHPSAGNHNG